MLGLASSANTTPNMRHETPPSSSKLRKLKHIAIHSGVRHSANLLARSGVLESFLRQSIKGGALAVMGTKTES